MAEKKRLTIRLSKKLKADAKCIAALKGMNLTEYIVDLINKDTARTLASRSQTIVLKDEVFDRFIAACENPEPPNEALREAVRADKEWSAKERQPTNGA